MRVSRITSAQARTMTRMAAGETLVRSLVGERLWSFREDPFTLLESDDLERLLAAGLIALRERGSRRENRADAHGLTQAGEAALAAHRERAGS